MAYRNKETLLVKIWYNPKTKQDLDYIKEAIDEKYNELGDTIFKDMINLQAIDWQELEEALDPEEEETEEE